MYFSAAVPAGPWRVFSSFSSRIEFLGWARCWDTGPVILHSCLKSFQPSGEAAKLEDIYVVRRGALYQDGHAGLCGSPGAPRRPRGGGGVLTWWWWRRGPGCSVCQTEATLWSTGLAAWCVVPVPVRLPLLPLRVHSQCPVQPLVFAAVVVFVTL